MAGGNLRLIRGYQDLERVSQEPPTLLTGEGFAGLAFRTLVSSTRSDLLSQGGHREIRFPPLCPQSGTQLSYQGGCSELSESWLLCPAHAFPVTPSGKEQGEMRLTPSAWWGSIGEELTLAIFDELGSPC